MDTSCHNPSYRPPRNHPVWWVIAISLAAIALNLTFRHDDSDLFPAAMAQTVQSAGARGIFAFTGQMTANTYGLYMVDVDNGTIWCYEIVTESKGIKKLRLVAARSWIFDRSLEEYNIDEPTPHEVEAMIEAQRAALKTRGTASTP